MQVGNSAKALSSMLRDMRTLLIGFFMTTTAVFACATDSDSSVPDESEVEQDIGIKCDSGHACPLDMHCKTPPGNCVQCVTNSDCRFPTRECNQRTNTCESPFGTL